MALIKLGMLASDVRGSIGGTTFARNRSGAYARNRTKPVNPATPLQTQSRARFGNQANGWSGLSGEDQSTWEGLAVTTTLLNRLGESYTPTGRQLYLQCNNNLQQIGTGPIATAPVDASPPDLNPEYKINVLVDTGVLDSMLGDGFGDVADVEYIVESVAPSAGNKQNMSNVYRYIGHYTFDGFSDLVGDYTAKYGPTAAADQVIFFRVRAINVTTGLVSAAVIYVATIEEVP